MTPRRVRAGAADGPSPSHPAAPRGSKTLAQTIDSYLDVRWRINPVEATHAGRHDLDHLFGRWDAESVRQYVAALRSFTMALEEIEAETLEDEIDQTAALHAARHDLLVLERERPFAKNPAFHLMHALGGLYLLILRLSQDPPARSRALLARLRALPEFLTGAVEALTEPQRVFFDAAQAMVGGGLSLIGEALGDASLDLSAIDPVELLDARDGAAEALHRFSDALGGLRDRATDDFAIGRDLFDRKLHTAHMIRENADELLRFGERLRAEATDGLVRIAREMRPGADWRVMVRELRADAPTAETAVTEYAAAMRSAREFTAARGVVDVPDAELTVCPTPTFLRAVTPFAAYQGPGAFDREQEGFFFVTLPDRGQPWRLHCRAELATTALHEGVPGHHLQVVTANRLDRTARRVLSSPVAQEGWALYCETLMTELGFISSPAERLFQMHHLLWRALRVVLDVSLHTKGLSMRDAAATLERELGLEPSAAEAEAVRYCAYPTYQLCYAVGRRDILRLREDARIARGAAWDLSAFHRDILRYGALPPPLARWGMGLE